MLNAPRTIPYSFKVVELEGIVWLFDDSSRWFPCTATPHIYGEPLYSIADSEDDLSWLDVALFTEEIVAKAKQVRGEYPADMSEKDAWEAAREEAHANHIL